jgi:SAM-dependent methyltransferase
MAMTNAVDEAKLQAFIGKMLGDLGAIVTAPLVLIGDRTGLYRALDDRGAQTPEQLASATGTDPRYVSEWCANQAASGYLEYDSGTGRFALPPEHAMVLAREDSPVNMQGAFEIAQTLMRDEPKLTQAFRDGTGVGWDEHDPQLYTGTARFFRGPYSSDLVSSWIPSLDGVEERLRAGIDVADVGCGFGISTTLMARAYPNSRFVGFDYHPNSIESARELARREGVDDRVSFRVAGATSFEGTYDLIALFDCLHDMGDPPATLRHIREALRADATLMIVEPFANDRLEENLNPIGRIFYGASSMICTPSAKAQSGGYALGAQAGAARMRAIATEAGFPSFRRAAETPFNLIYEAKP